MKRAHVRNPSPAALIVEMAANGKRGKMAQKKKKAGGARRATANKPKRRNPPSLSKVTVSGSPLIQGVAAAAGGMVTEAAYGMVGNIGGDHPGVQILRKAVVAFGIGYVAEKIPFIKKYAPAIYFGGMAATGATIVAFARAYAQGRLAAASAPAAGVNDITALQLQSWDPYYGTQGVGDIITRPQYQ